LNVSGVTFIIAILPYRPDYTAHTFLHCYLLISFKIVN